LSEGEAFAFGREDFWLVAFLPGLPIGSPGIAKYRNGFNKGSAAISYWQKCYLNATYFLQVDLGTC